MRGVLCNAFDGIKALTIGEAEEPLHWVAQGGERLCTRPRADEV